MGSIDDKVKVRELYGKTIRRKEGRALQKGWRTEEKPPA
jgi:hypothetical protein